jgi:hypothetical protein
VAYGASLESWLGASPHGFESHILREHLRVSKTLECETAGYFFLSSNREAEDRRFLLGCDKTGGNQMDPKLPTSGYDFIWIIAAVGALLPVATIVLLALILREAIRLRRGLEKKE